MFIQSLYQKKFKEHYHIQTHQLKKDHKRLGATSSNSWLKHKVQDYECQKWLIVSSLVLQKRMVFCQVLLKELKEIGHKTRFLF